MVAPTNSDLSRLVGVRGLFDVGRLSGNPLYLGALSLAVLFAGTFWIVAACLVWAEAGGVAGLAAVLTGAADSLDAGRFSADLLLLSWGVLQIVLGGPAVLQRERTAQSLSRGTVLPVDHAECAPVFSLFGPDRPGHSGVRRLESILVRRWLRHRRGHDHSGGKCVAAGRIFVRLPFVAPFDRRFSRRDFAPQAGPANVSVRQLSEPPPHALGLDEPGVGNVFGRLRAALRDGRLARHSSDLTYARIPDPRA